MKKWISNGCISIQRVVMNQYTCPECGRISNFAGEPEDTCPWCGKTVGKAKVKKSERINRVSGADGK